MHKNVRKFVCDICNKRYVQKVSLMKHRQRCTRESFKADRENSTSRYITEYETVEGQIADDSVPTSTEDEESEMYTTALIVSNVDEEAGEHGLIELQPLDDSSEELIDDIKSEVILYDSNDDVNSNDKYFLISNASFVQNHIVPKKI